VVNGRLWPVDRGGGLAVRCAATRCGALRCGAVRSSLRRRWSICHRRSQTMVDAPPQVPDAGRSADISSACPGGWAATVLLLG